MSRLGCGTGMHGWNGSSEQTRIGHQNLVNLIKLGYKHGITFWDSADVYGSHPHIADALEGIDRSSVTIITKSFSKSPKAIGQGKLNADVRKCFEFILDQPYIDAITVGMNSEEQLMQNLSLVNEYTSTTQNKKATHS
jgi:aryl-alcohol dehydrogenase-like predicted oxidoreductase